MWCLETISQINSKVAELARTGEHGRDALRECGISLPHHCVSRNTKPVAKDETCTVVVQDDAPMM